MSTGLRGLKSGTDVRGRALGEDAPLTAAVAARIGGAFVAWLRQRGVDNPRVAVGRDSRVTGEMLLDACAEGCMKAGAQVETYGMCTTPAMYMSLITEGFGCDGSVMITASHHPYDRNGLKFFTKEGGIDSHDLDAILDIAESDAPLSGGSSPIVKRDFLPVYCEQLKDRVRKGLNTDVQKPLLGLHVVVDAGNGAGGFYAGLLEDLGAWIEGSQFLEPDGMFPNHIPNPENEQAMASISAAVVKAGADLGVIFDTDCDRAAIVDRSGREINRNRLIALISAVLLDKQPGLTIVTDSVTSSGLAQFIMEWGGEHYRYKRGYRNVIDEQAPERSGAELPPGYRNQRSRRPAGKPFPGRRHVSGHGADLRSHAPEERRPGADRPDRRPAGAGGERRNPPGYYRRGFPQRGQDRHRKGNGSCRLRPRLAHRPRQPGGRAHQF